MAATIAYISASISSSLGPSVITGTIALSDTNCSKRHNTEVTTSIAILLYKLLYFAQHLFSGRMLDLVDTAVRRRSLHLRGVIGVEVATQSSDDDFSASGMTTNYRVFYMITSLMDLLVSTRVLLMQAQAQQS